MVSIHPSTRPEKSPFPFSGCSRNRRSENVFGVNFAKLNRPENKTIVVQAMIVQIRLLASYFRDYDAESVAIFIFFPSDAMKAPERARHFFGCNFASRLSKQTNQSRLGHPESASCTQRIDMRTRIPAESQQRATSVTKLHHSSKPAKMVEDDKRF